LECVSISGLAANILFGLLTAFHVWLSTEALAVYESLPGHCADEVSTKYGLDHCTKSNFCWVLFLSNSFFLCDFCEKLETRRSWDQDLDGVENLKISRPGACFRAKIESMTRFRSSSLEFFHENLHEQTFSGPCTVALIFRNVCYRLFSPFSWKKFIELVILPRYTPA